jgi:CheY-like chemotaxis protein
MLFNDRGVGMGDMNKDATLFLIEDDDVDALSVERAFSKLRIANPIIRARDGIEALSMLESNQVPKPYVILLDLQMPRMNGLEFLEAVRSSDSFQHSVIFVLTTSRSEEERTLAYKKQIAGYFLKDVSGSGCMDVSALLNGYWKISILPT